MNATVLQIGSIEPSKLCERAVHFAEVKLGRRAITKGEACTALSAISNLFCRHSLCEPMPRVTIVNGFACDCVATANAIRAEIARSLPSLSPSLASTIYLSLVRALDEEFHVHKYDAVRVDGFGVFRPTGGATFEYQLTFDLPVKEYLKAMALPPR
ncbi:MAG: hypothetical protein HY820_01155 [Acidobacteria bacterium]|nr:hypothetical protein [Acidobacteriota bacterium]